MKKYYRIIRKADRRFGLIYADLPNGEYGRVALDGQPVENLDKYSFELKDGDFPSISRCTDGSQIIDEDIKEIFDRYAEKEFLELLPVTVKSEEYGDRTCYIVHFTKIYDVIDYERSKYAGENITVAALVFEKVKNLHVFNTQPIINDLYISEEVMQEIKKKKLNKGFQMVPRESF